MTFPQPSSPAPMYPPLVASGLTPLGGVVNWVKGLIIVSMLLSAVELVAEGYLISVFDRDSSVFDISATTDRVYQLSGVVALFDLVVFVAAGICVMVLFKRMADNGAKIFPQEVEHKSHWAITGWLIPFLGFVRPYQMVRQIWATSRDGNRYSGSEPLPESVKLWWGLFLARYIGAVFVPGTPWEGAATMDQLANEAIGLFIMNAVQLAAGLAFLVMLKALVERHERALVDPWVRQTPPPVAPNQGPPVQGPPVQWAAPTPSPGLSGPGSLGPSQSGPGAPGPGIPSSGIPAAPGLQQPPQSFAPPSSGQQPSQSFAPPSTWQQPTASADQHHFGDRPNPAPPTDPSGGTPSQ